MPWYLDELGRPDEVDWYFAEGQDIPSTISLAKVVPERKTWPLKVIQRGTVDGRQLAYIPDFTVGPVVGTVVVSKRFEDLVKRFDPKTHHFVPLEIERPDGAVWRDTHSLFKFGSFIKNGIQVEKSDVSPNIRNGKERAYLIPISINKNRSDRIWKLFGKEQVAGRYGLSSKACDAAEQSPNTASGGLFRPAGPRCAA